MSLSVAETEYPKCKKIEPYTKGNLITLNAWMSFRDWMKLNNGYVCNVHGYEARNKNLFIVFSSIVWSNSTE